MDDDHILPLPEAMDADHILTLPNEMLGIIMEHVTDKNEASLVCSTFYNICCELQKNRYCLVLQGERVCEMIISRYLLN